ncbi:MAG: hypothetical protein NC124_18620 [Clostridium sp.]|nr:hypothetical protein [Clostridium sp.]
MKMLKKRNVWMLMMVLLLGVLALPGTVQAAGKKNASDVKALNAIIKKQRAAGAANVPTDLNAECYQWNSKGRLTGIQWTGEVIYPVPKLKGSISFAKLPALEYLGLSGELTSINVRKNKKLEGLDCGGNKLKKLDVSKNTKLEYLNCFGNKLTKLNLSKNKNLTDLYCFENKLTKLDLSKNVKLKELECSHNKLTELNVSNCKKLGGLSCGNNKLKSLDVSNNTELYSLDCKKNNIRELDLTNNKKLEHVVCDKKVNVTR